MKKKILTLSLLLFLSIATGCKNAAPAADTASDVPALLTPADTPINTVTVGYNDIAVSEYYNAIVTPYVEEYVFPMAGTLSAVNVILDEKVEAGAILAELNHSEIDSRIAALEKEIDILKSTIEKDTAECTIILDSLKTQKTNILSGKAKSSNPTAEALILDYDIKLYETKIEQNKTKLEIELKGPTDELSRLKKELESYYIYAPFSGTVIYITDKTKLTPDITAIALANLERKYIQISDTISDSHIASAVNLYATYNGSTYNLTHVPLDSQPTSVNLKSAKGSLSNFIADNKSMKLFPYGCRMLVTIDTAFIDNVLSIPNTALFTDENGMHYVYSIDTDGIRTRRDIVTGETDTIYTVIVDGLKEGDVIYVPD